MRKAKKEKKNIKIHLIQADADHLPLQSNKFDVVFVFTVLQNMPSPIKTVTEIKLAAKSNGVIVLTGLKKVFSLKTINNILRKTGLKTIALETGSDLKDYVTINEKEK